MRGADIARLILLAAIWGGSFPFLRLTVPELGPLATAEARLALAGVTILLYLRLMGIALEWRCHWRHYVIVGVANSAAPFVLYAWSAQHLPASYLAVINAVSPLFGALVATLWLGERLTANAELGMAVGICGVAILVGLGPLAASAVVVVAALAGLAAAACYAIGGGYIKRRSLHTEPSALAGGSQIAAAVMLTPPALASLPAALPSSTTVFAALALGVLCTGIAYLLYFRLIADIGPARALTVTFLIPVFGMAWASLLLGEPITLTMVVGCALVLVGTGLILGWRPERKSPRDAAARGDYR
jgi:drug/metabolite transporter (DMT)-like permease